MVFLRNNDSWDIHNNIHKKQEENTGNWHGRIQYSNCDNWNDHDFIFCKHCGKRLKE